MSNKETFLLSVFGTFQYLTSYCEVITVSLHTFQCEHLTSRFSAAGQSIDIDARFIDERLGNP
uniref:Uncharacterized protein n=1 Tax=Meloidogyne incognita TaxID=6306 RepID=A0A914L6K5_MELIC